MFKKTSILLLLISSATGAWAQQLYKSKGADGKVVYSDRPIDGKTTVATMRGTVIHPVVEEPAAVAKPVQRTLVAADQSLVTPDVEDTMLRIMELVEFGKRFLPLCSGSDKATKEFIEAHKGWMSRNALYVEQQKRLLMEVVSPSRRAAMLQRLAANQRGGVKARSGAESDLALCGGFTAGLNNGSSDIVKPTMLAIPLTAYRSK